MSAQLAHDLIELSCGPVMPVLSRAVRSMLIAVPGRKLLGADYSGIEARVNAWMAGETWKLQAFRDYDTGTGPNLYNLAYSRCFGGRPEDVRKGSVEYDIGKKAELSCGYQGSIGAFLRFMPDVDSIVPIVKEKSYGTTAWRRAAEQYDGSVHHYALTSDQWVCIKIIISSWRDGHPAIVQSWWGRQDAAVEAVAAPGVRMDVCGGKVSYLMAEGFLWCRLPTGKLIGYCRPRLVETREDYLVDADGEVFPIDDELTEDEIAERVAAGAVLRTGRRRVQVQFEGVNQKTRQWGKQRLYGGLQCNNDVQGTAREILRMALHRVEEAGYPVVLHVHDELVAEVAQEFGSSAELESLMGVLDPCLAGLPLVAKAWQDRRYVK